MPRTPRLLVALAALAAVLPAAAPAATGAGTTAVIICPHTASAPPLFYGSLRVDVSLSWDSCTHHVSVHCLVRNSNSQLLHIDNCAGRYVSTGSQWAVAPSPLPMGQQKVETWAPRFGESRYITPGTHVYGYVAARYRMANGQWSGTLQNRTDDVGIT